MSWARIQYDRKQVNKVLKRCKNGAHRKSQRRELRNQQRLEDNKGMY